MHLPSYAAGVVFHLGTFAAFGLLATTLAGIDPPAALTRAAALVTLAGAAGGLALLVKRVVTPYLRGLSSPRRLRGEPVDLVCGACGRGLSASAA